MVIQTEVTDAITTLDTTCGNPESAVPPGHVGLCSQTAVQPDCTRTPF